MKKLAAMLLSLVMCFSLLAIPAQAASIPDPDVPNIADTDGDSTKSGDDDPDKPKKPEKPDPQKTLPGPVEDLPGIR